jgi:hypothetical protein
VVIMRDTLLAYAVFAALVLSPVLIIAWACACALVLL